MEGWPLDMWSSTQYLYQKYLMPLIPRLCNRWPAFIPLLQAPFCTCYSWAPSPLSRDIRPSVRPPQHRAWSRGYWVVEVRSQYYLCSAGLPVSFIQHLSWRKKKKREKKADLDSLKIYNTAPKPTESLVMFFEFLRYTTATNVHS